MILFQSFVVIGAMRTGSNYLEQNLAAIPNVTTFGEAFNPAFIGKPKATTLCGMTLQDREADPRALLQRMRAQGGLTGYRHFAGHDPRALAACVADTSCAKIILSRNPFDSYVSLLTAQATGQWQLTKAGRPKTARVTVDPVGFAQYHAEQNAFYREVEKALQRAGQAAFALSYEDLFDVDTFNGLLRYLGLEHQETRLPAKLVKQATLPMSERVVNYAEVAHLQTDPLWQSEPAKGARVGQYVVANRAGLVFTPLATGHDRALTTWMGHVGGGTKTGLNRKQLHDWRNQQRSPRSFAVLQHPLARAHHTFCSYILGRGDGAFANIRQRLRQNYGLPIPETGVDFDKAGTYSLADHRAAFAAFLSFVDMNLNGRTSIRVDQHWASQSANLHGINSFMPVDRVLRREELSTALPELATTTGAQTQTTWSPCQTPGDAWLDQIADRALEKLCRDTYRRDYNMFGFSDFRPDQAA